MADTILSPDVISEDNEGVFNPRLVRQLSGFVLRVIRACITGGMLVAFALFQGASSSKTITAFVLVVILCSVASINRILQPATALLFLAGLVFWLDGDLSTMMRRLFTMA